MQELDSKLRAPLRKVRKLSTIFLFAALTPALFAQKIWVEQGPGPIINGQDVGLTNPTNPVSGAINAIAPLDANTVYVGAVNGGVWKTTNAMATAPTWTPLTDKHLKALSIRSLAISPLNSSHIFAGTGSSSSYSNRGDPGFGVARSLDGGTNWTVEAASTFTGKPIVSIVPTSARMVVLAATGKSGNAGNGLFRSTDNGKVFTLLSGDGASGLPSGGVSDIAGDPSSSHRFYAAVPDIYSSSTSVGVYKSEDDGATWKFVSSGLTVLNSAVIRLSVSKADGAVYAMVMNSDSTLGGIFRSTNQGTSWTQMDTPTPTIFPGTQAGDQGAIVAHPTLAGIVFVGGDYHPQTNGCTDFGGNIRRGDASQAAGSQWTDVVCNGANGTAPHADTRAFAFDTTGTILLHGDDGGLFELNNPDSAARVWTSFNGDIRPSEIHNIAYDPLSHVLLSGNQDTGDSYQLSANSLTWTDISSGDGAFVAVDADQTAHSGSSIRYYGYIKLQSFNRSTFGSNNVQTAVSALALNIQTGNGSGQTILAYDTTRQFNNPYVLNNINPSRMLIGTSSLYESSDKGDNFTNLGTLGAPVSSMSYGSALDTVSFPDTFYVGAGSSIYHRVTSGNAPTVLTAYPGKTIVSLVMNPLDYQNVYVLDNTGSVYGSTDEGATWTNFTFDLATKMTQPQTIEIFSPPLGKGNKNDQHLRIIVGGIGDIVHIRPKAGDTLWTKAGDGLPKGAFIYDLHYNVACDTLVAGSLGRGAWTLASPFSISAGGTCPPVVASGNTGAQSSIGVTGANAAMRQLSAEPNATENNPPVANTAPVLTRPKAH
jgi:hypothetical protein